MLFSRRYIANLEAQIKALENELKRTQELRETDRKEWENQREVLVSRLLEKNGVPQAPGLVGGKGGPEGLMSMPVFEDLEEAAEEAIAIRKKERVDAFAG